MDQKNTGLRQCSACKVAHHCSVDHQRAHRPQRKPTCGKVKEARGKLEREEATLRAHEGDTSIPPNPFENAVGIFWFWSPARPYLRTRFDVASALLNVRTGEEALGHLTDMLRLCRGDNLEVRSQIAALLLRLGRDQEAWDFMKWWAVKPDSYDFKNTDLPYLDLRNEDAFEPFDGYAKKMIDLSFLSSMTLIKVRLMMNLMTLRREVEAMGRSHANEGSNDASSKLLRLTGRPTRAHPAPKKPFRLLDIHGELRNKIYENMLSKDGDLMLRQLFRKYTIGDPVAPMYRIGMKHSLLLTCKIVRSEGTAILLKSNCITICRLEDTPCILRPRASAVCNSITCLHLKEFG